MKSVSRKMCGEVLPFDRNKLVYHLNSAHRGYPFSRYKSKYLTGSSEKTKHLENSEPKEEKNDEIYSNTNSETEYEVEAILSSKIDDGKKLFLVKWKA